MENSTSAIINQLKEELEALDQYPVDIDGIQMKPSQCYRMGTEPAHILFNTNCPDGLRRQVEDILKKHLPDGNHGE